MWTLQQQPLEGQLARHALLALSLSSAPPLAITPSSAAAKLSEKGVACDSFCYGLPNNFSTDYVKTTSTSHSEHQVYLIGYTVKPSHSHHLHIDFSHSWTCSCISFDFYFITKSGAAQHYWETAQLPCLKKGFQNQQIGAIASL